MCYGDLTRYDYVSPEMRKYLGTYGKHFNKRLSEFAASKMWKRDGNGNRVHINSVDKDALHEMLKAQGVVLENNQLYDAVYVANMFDADFASQLGSNDTLKANFIKCVIDDPDACDGTVFNRWYSDMCHKGIAIDWEDMI